MQFVEHRLGHRRGGEMVEVTLSGNAANVRLMDSSNFNSYKAGRQHRSHFPSLRACFPARMVRTARLGAHEPGKSLSGYRLRAQRPGDTASIEANT